MKRRGGQYIGSFPAYGYRKDPQNHNRLLIDAHAAEVVREIYRLYLSGMGKQRIAAELNARGLPNPTLYKQQQGLRYVNGGQQDARDWNRTSVGRILKNPLYAGDLVQGVRRKASYKSKKLLTVPPEEWIVVPNAHAPIIDRETFETVGRMLARRTRSSGTGEPHPLAGLVRCMDCGGAMLKYSNVYQGRRRSYLRCKGCLTGACTAHAIRLELLESDLLALLQKRLAGCDMAALAKRLASARDNGADRREHARLRAEIARRENAAKALYLDKADGVISPEQFVELNRAYLAEKSALEKQLAALETQREATPEGPAPPALDKLTRPLAALMVKRVEIGERNRETCRQPVRITWNF